MQAAAQRHDDLELLTWTEIRESFPDEWVDLIDIEYAADGALRRARVLHHEESIVAMLELIDTPMPKALLTYTWGDPQWTPHRKPADASRNIIPPEA